jgi:hypothetical protein
MPDWKTKVQMEGKSLQDLLETSVGELSREKTVEAILRQNGYLNILSEEQKQTAQRKADNQALLEKTLNQKGRKYIIDYSALSKPGGIRSFDPMNVTMITPKIRVHTRSVKFAGDNLFTADFSQPVVEDLGDKSYTAVVPVNENESITIDGFVTDLRKPAEMQFSKSLVITSRNFNFEAVTGSIKISNEEIVIRLADKK